MTTYTCTKFTPKWPIVSYSWKKSMVTPNFFRALFYLDEKLTISNSIKKFCNAFFWKMRKYHILR